MACGPASPWTTRRKPPLQARCTSDAAAKLAVLVKSTRNAMMDSWFSAMPSTGQPGAGQGGGNKAAFLWQKFPKFVLGFLLISVLATYHFFNKDQVGALANLSRWAFLLTFAGVGLRTNFSDMRKQGLRRCGRSDRRSGDRRFTLALVYGGGGKSSAGRQRHEKKHGPGSRTPQT